MVHSAHLGPFLPDQFPMMTGPFPPQAQPLEARKTPKHGLDPGQIIKMVLAESWRSVRHTRKRC